MTRSDKFNQYLGIALGFHIALSVVLLLGEQFSLFSFQNQEIIEIESAVKVDVVAMPKFTIQELKKAKIVPVKTEDAADKIEDLTPKVEEKTEQVVEEADVDLNKLFQDLSSKELEKPKSKPKKKQESRIGTGDQEKIKKLVLEGNKISKGSAVVGDPDYSKSQLYSEYVQKLPFSVRPYWSLPEYLLNKGLRARIQIFISASGKILNYKIYESSGDKEFDKRALMAVRRADSVPPPPDKIALRVASGEVILGFPL